MRNRGPSLFFLQMPVLLAGRISDLSLQNVSNDATNNIHSGTTFIGIDFMK